MDFEIIKELAEESRRIIIAPYSVSLQKLLQVLQKAKPLEIECWAQCHGCQIKPLAAAVLEGLQLWPHTLKVIGRLCLAKACRDALLDADRSFLGLSLDTLQSLNPPPADLEDTCIQLLKHPLPLSHPIPASIRSLCSRLVSQAVASPSITTFQPLYSVIKGIGNDIHSCVAGYLPIDLRRQLTQSLKCTDDHMVSLLCLATLARLTPSLPPQSRTEDATSREISMRQIQNVTSSEKKPLQAKPLFVGKRAHNALELAILQAIIACSEKLDHSEPASHEVLALATVIVGAVDANDRLLWIKNSTHIVQKYYERVFCRELNEVLRLAGFELWMVLTEGCQLQNSDEDVTIVEAAITRSSLSIRPKFANFGNRLSIPFVKSQLIRALNIASCTTNFCTVSSLLEFKTTTWIMESLLEMVKTKHKLRKTILIALTSNDLRTTLQRFLTFRSEVLPWELRHHTEVCTREALAAILILQKKLCSLFLHASIYSTFDDIVIDPAHASGLLEKIQEVSIHLPECGFFQSSSKSPSKAMSLFQNGEIPTKQSGDWRDRLASELNHEANQARSRIIRFVHDVCRDLEERCDDVERPLREEREKSLELKKEVAALSKEAFERAAVLSSIEAREETISERLRNREESLTALTTELKTVRQAASDASETSKKDAENAREALETQHLEHQNALASRNVILKDQAARLASLETSLNAVKEKANQLESELSKSNETHSLLLNQRTCEMEQARKTSAKQVREMEKLRHAEKEKTKESEILRQHMTHLEENFSGEKTTMRDRISSLESMLAEAHQKLQSSFESYAAEISGFEEKVAILDQALSSNSEQHTLELVTLKAVMTRMDKETSARAEQLSVEIADLKKGLSNAEENTASISRQYGLEIKRLENQLKDAREASVTASEKHTDDSVKLKKKIAHLTSEGKERARELSEALDLRNKMINLMNLPNPAAQAANTIEAMDVSIVRKLDPMSQVWLESSTSTKEKPKQKRTHQTCDLEMLGPSQVPISTRPKSIKSPQSRAEKREPLRDRRATFHNTIIRSSTRSPQKNTLTWIRPQRGLDDAKNVELSGFEDLDNISFGGTQVLTSTQPRKQLEMGDGAMSEVDLDATI